MRGGGPESLSLLACFAAGVSLRDPSRYFEHADICGGAVSSIIVMLRSFAA
jgi:hypothetical protein